MDAKLFLRLLSLFAWFHYIYIIYISSSPVNATVRLPNPRSQGPETFLAPSTDKQTPQLRRRVLKPPYCFRIFFKRCWYFKRSYFQNLFQIRFSVTFRQNCHLQVRRNIALWNHSSLVQNSARKTDHRIYIATCKVCHEYHGQESRNYCLCSVHLDTKCR